MLPPTTSRAGTPGNELTLPLAALPLAAGADAAVRTAEPDGSIRAERGALLAAKGGVVLVDALLLVDVTPLATPTAAGAAVRVLAVSHYGTATSSTPNTRTPAAKSARRTPADNIPRFAVCAFGAVRTAE